MTKQKENNLYLKLTSEKELNLYADWRFANNGGGYHQPELTYQGTRNGNPCELTIRDTSCGDFGERLTVQFKEMDLRKNITTTKYYYLDTVEREPQEESTFTADYQDVIDFVSNAYASIRTKEDIIREEDDKELADLSHTLAYNKITPKELNLTSPVLTKEERNDLINYSWNLDRLIEDEEDAYNRYTRGEISDKQQEDYQKCIDKEFDSELKKISAYLSKHQIPQRLAAKKKQQQASVNVVKEKAKKYPNRRYLPKKEVNHKSKGMHY